MVFRLSDLAARDLWTDEAWVALAALKASPGAALAAGQSTPPFYLLTVWAAAKVLGGQEWALRSLSCAFGVGTLLIFWLLVRRLATRPVALLALAAVAFSPIMVYYSKELKQYSGDAFFAVLVFYLAERLRASGGRRGWPALALAGVVGLGFSHPLIFSLPAVGLILWLSLPAARGRLALLGGLWVLAFGGLLLPVLPPGAGPGAGGLLGPGLSGFFRLLAVLPLAGERPVPLFLVFLRRVGAGLGSAPAAGRGLRPVARRGRAGSWSTWGGPILLAFGAAALHRYPFMAHYGGNRLMLFSAPLLYLLVAAGAGLVFSWLWQGRRKWLAAASGRGPLLVSEPLLLPRENLHPLMNREEISPLVARLERERQPRDWVYVYYFAKWPFRLLLPRLRPKRRAPLYRQILRGDGSEAEPPGRDPARLWLIASHIPDLKDMREFAAKLLGPEWRETACYQSEGAVLFCFYGPQVRQGR